MPHPNCFSSLAYTLYTDIVCVAAAKFAGDLVISRIDRNMLAVRPSGHIFTEKNYSVDSRARNRLQLLLSKVRAVKAKRNFFVR